MKSDNEVSKVSNIPVETGISCIRNVSIENENENEKSEHFPMSETVSAVGTKAYGYKQND